MKKFFLYAILFAVHFAVLLVCNWILGGSVNIIQTLVSSVVFILVYPAVLHFLAKRKRVKTPEERINKLENKE